MTRGRALIAMSGGVDSAAAAALMLQEGWDCVGATMKLFAGGSRCCSLEDINDARQAAFALGIPHYVLNFTESFREDVIGRFINVYESGGTPNPCIDCNRYIKFTGLLRRARELECDTLVTGHYARIEKSPGGRLLLKKAIDSRKDQSYVLYMLTQNQLERIRLPLGGLTKAEAREIARERGFVNAGKAESQDICFVPDGDYGAFMERFTGKTYPSGDIVDSNGAVVGRHRGLVRYTLGQRRGLGVAANQPVYVAGKDLEHNRLTLACESALYKKTLRAEGINLIALDKISGGLRAAVMTRYQQKENQATIYQEGEDLLRVEFDEPQRAPTPGQSAVFYDGDTVLGGGVITATS